MRTTSHPVPRPTRPRHAAAGRATDYAPFPDMQGRNGLQSRVEIPLMIRALALPRHGHVLEIGCGRGVALPEFARRLAPAALVGLDLDRTLVDIARRRVDAMRIDATVMQGDVRDLPFDDASFDLVVDFGTCYHVSGGVDGARAALAQVARVLRPGGLFAHETPVAQHLAHPVRSFARGLPWGSVPALVRDRVAVLWAARRRRSDA